MFDLSGRTALVTGAGRNVGAGIALALAAQGAAVAVNDFHRDRAEQTVDAIVAAGGRATAVPADMADPGAIGAAVDRVEATLGPVDILVNNAGIPAAGLAMARFRELAVDDWDAILRLNLYGVLHSVKAVIDGMCDRGWGRIVTISSEAGRHGLPSGLSIYGAAKAGAVGFTRHLAHEVGRFGVTANCVSLGTMDNQPSERTVRGTPMRRLGTPDDIGAAVCYLASDEASWVTGQNLPVNGGYFTS